MEKKDKKANSERVMEASHVKNLLNRVPDIRTDKVMGLKKDIKSGSYEVDPEKVAEKIIIRTLKDSVKKKS